ncbi:MAG: pyruvate kinase [Bacteroidales bacterium]|nr:pyruvate kinase [Bacteroidales bacterium]
MKVKKLTKIVATISDRRCDVDFIRSLYDAGMNVARINTAHADFDATRQMIANIRSVSNSIAILIDTKGPEIRTTQAGDGFAVNEGDTVYFAGSLDKECGDGFIYVNRIGFENDVPFGKRILIDDGDIAFETVDRDENGLKCKVLNSGIVKSRKSVNVPGVPIKLPSLSEKDKKFIQLAIEEDITFIAHSFVRCKEDVICIQQILDEAKSKIKIIAKIENQQGVDNIDEILDHAYGIMIARGDLGIEIEAERIPAIQKELNRKAIDHLKPVIVATQMLHTMINNPRPTRAEVSDVANAIYDGADAVMLSGETASGQYPVEAVKTMSKIAIEVEAIKEKLKENTHPVHVKSEISEFLCKNAVHASVELDARCIIADSFSGTTIRNLAAYRGAKPIYAMCYNENVVRELALSYGVVAHSVKLNRSADDFIQSSVSFVLNKQFAEIDDKVVLLAGSFGKGNSATLIEVNYCCNLVKRY